MPLKPLGKTYLLPDEVEQDELVEIIEKPYIVPAEKTKWGKDRGRAQVKILRNGQIRTWTMNVTTWDRLIQAFGEDEALWLRKKVQIRKEMRNVSGVDKQVLYGRPYREPQQNLNPAPAAVAVKSDLLQKINALSPEYKQELLKLLQGQEQKT